jgi:hypothetical protein
MPEESSVGIGVGLVVLDSSQEIVYQETLNLGDS